MFQSSRSTTFHESWIHANREETTQITIDWIKAVATSTHNPQSRFNFFLRWRIKLPNLLLTFCWNKSFVDSEFNKFGKLKFSVVTLHHPSRCSTTFLKPTINPAPFYHIIRSSLFLNMRNSIMNEKFNSIINPYRFKRLSQQVVKLFTSFLVCSYFSSVAAWFKQIEPFDASNTAARKSCFPLGANLAAMKSFKNPLTANSALKLTWLK